MPKSHKRKNAGVGIDFKRAKHKVGRKLPAARNATFTTIKSGTLTLTQQSLAVDRAGQAVTERNLTLKEVLGQCGHYSERVRREALDGLAQLSRSDPGGVRRAAAPVLDAICARFVDSDAGVRGTLAVAAREAILPALGAAGLGPFLPRVMAALSAALTHMAPPVRADALRLLGILADAAPACLSPAFLPGLLSHYGTLLGRPARGRTLAAGSPESLAATLTGLEALLCKAVGLQEAENGDRLDLARAANVLLHRAPDESAASAAAEAFWLHALRDPGRTFYLPQPDGMALLGLDEATAWIQTVPKVLWKLGGRQPQRSLRLLRALLAAARSAPAGGPLHAALCALRPQMLVLWGMVRRGGKKAAPKLHLGPLAELGSSAQALAADMLAQLGPPTEAALNMTCWVALSDSYPQGTAARLVANLCVPGWEAGLDGTQGRAEVPELGASLLRPLLAWHDAQGTVQPSADTERHRCVIGSLTQVLLASGRPDVLVAHALEGLSDGHDHPTTGSRADTVPDATSDSAQQQQPPPFRELGTLGVLAAVGRRQAVDLPESFPATATAMSLKLVDGEATMPATGWAADARQEAGRRAALGAILSAAEALPGLSPMLLAACAGAAHENLLPRLQLTLDLLSHAPLHGALLALRSQVAATLCTLRSTVDGLHTADPCSQPARELLARCAARAQLVLGSC